MDKGLLGYVMRAIVALVLVIPVKVTATLMLKGIDTVYSITDIALSIWSL